MEEVTCPGCGLEKFPATACSECYCSCGTAFRISEDLMPIRVARGLASQRATTPGVVRKLLSGRPEKPRPA